MSQAHGRTAETGEEGAIRGLERPQAVVFDADGVLLDTEPSWEAARSALFARYGRAFGAVERRDTLGTGTAGTGRLLGRLIGRPEHAGQLADELVGLLSEELGRTPPRPLPGALSLLRELRGLLPVAVASNSPRPLLERALEVAGLAESFDAIVGGDEAPRPKPAPDLYLAAAHRVGADPARSVALEDSPAGVASARAAGLHVIGVGSATSLDDADEVVESLADPAIRVRVGLAAQLP